MIPRAFRSFVHDLLNATNKGDLQWTEGNVDAYFCSRRDATVHVSSHMDHDADKTYIRLLFSAAGRVTPFAVTRGETDFPGMEGLYTSVVASANHVDEDLKQFFKS